MQRESSQELNLAVFDKEDIISSQLTTGAAEGIAFEQYAEAYKFIDEQGDNIMKVMIDL